MTRVDMHPEELIDGARRGELSAADRARLDLHVEHCASCRFELDVASDFARERAPQASDSARLSKIVGGALAGVGLPDAGRASTVEAGRPARTMRRKLVAVGGTALALGLLGGAAAAFFLASPREEPEPTPDAIEVTEPSPPAPPARAEAREAVEEEVVEGAPVVEEEAQPARPAIAREPLTAEELFARGNAARREGRYDQAERMYRTLQRAHPSSREASVSRVTLGRLLLDGRGSPAAALEQFDRYLASHPAGVLAEEARVGRALALGRLGRREEERGAWRDLLAHHPDTLHAERARRALE